MFHVPEESSTNSEGADNDASARGEVATRAAAAGIGAIAPGTFAPQATNKPIGRGGTSDLDAEVLRHTTGKHWRQQREDVPK